MPPLARIEAEAIVRRAVDDGRIEREPAERLASSLGEPSVREAVLEGADESRRRGKCDVVTVSRNIFIPLTNLCRDRCAKAEEREAQARRAADRRAEEAALKAQARKQQLGKSQ